MSIIKQRLLALSILIAGLGLCLPMYKQLYKLYFRCDREYIKAEFELPPEIEVSPLEQLESETLPPREIANNAEVILISGYEPDDELDSGIVEVNIDRPGKNVLLVLTSYDKVSWQVAASSATNITGVILDSHHSSTVTNIDSSQVFPVELPYSYELENKNFVETVEQLDRWFGVERVDAFRGHYSLPSRIKVSQIDPLHPALTLAGYPVREPVNNFEFDLYDENYEPVKWTLTGANNPSDRSTISPTGIAVSPDGTEIYELTDTGIKITNKKSGKQKEYKLPRKFPELSWGTDIAYDSKRDLVSLVSFGAEGYFYRFDVNKRRWLDVRSTNNIDIQSLTYDRISDRYLALVEDYGQGEGELLFISGDGELLSRETIGDRLKGFYRQYDRDNYPAPVVEIVAKGNNIALMTRSGKPWERDIARSHRLGSPIHSIWHYKLDSKTIQLTYKSN